MPGKCEICDRFIFILNKCELCAAKYCDKCQHRKHLRFPFSQHTFPLHLHWTHNVRNSPYTKQLIYNIPLCQKCYYNYSSNISENYVSDSVLGHIFLKQIIKDYDIIIIYDSPHTSNNSAFLFFSDLHKLMNQKKNAQRYPYELFYYTQFPDTPWLNKKESPGYKQAFNTLPQDTANIIISYDNVFLDARKLRELAARFIQANDDNTKALGGFLAQCAKYEISVWPFDDYAPKNPLAPLSLRATNNEANIIQKQRTICNDILKQHVAITPFRGLSKKAIIVESDDTSHNYSARVQAQMQLHTQMKYVLQCPPYNKTRYKVATIEKRFMNNGIVKLIKKHDDLFLLTY